MRVEIKYDEKTTALIRQASDAREKCRSAIIRRCAEARLPDYKINEMIFTDPAFSEITGHIDRIYKLSIPLSITFYE